MQPTFAAGIPPGAPWIGCLEPRLLPPRPVTCPQVRPGPPWPRLCCRAAAVSERLRSCESQAGRGRWLVPEVSACQVL